MRSVAARRAVAASLTAVVGATAQPATAPADETASRSAGAAAAGEDQDAPEPPAADEAAVATPPAPPAPAPAQTAPQTVPAPTQYPTPGTPPPGLQPPGLPETEYWRREVELAPQLGLAWPRCRAGELSSNTCEGVKSGAYLGFAALWRVSPYFAWGGTLDMVALRYEPPPELHRDRAGAAAYLLGLAARVYFAEEGSLDPYVQLALGGAALATAFEEGSGTDQQRYEETGAGPALQFGAGVDFYLTPLLRLGPALNSTLVFVDKIRRCHGGGEGECVDVAKGAHGHVDAYATIGARLTISLGDEL